jgi:hypothetical protein
LDCRRPSFWRSCSQALASWRRPIVDIFIFAAQFIQSVYQVAASQRATMSPCGWLPPLEEIGPLANTTKRMLRRGYFPGDLQALQAFGCTSSFASGAHRGKGRWFVAPCYSELQWGIVPLIMFRQCRLWLLTARDHRHKNRSFMLWRLGVSWIAVGCIALRAASAAIVVPLVIIRIVLR